MTDRTLAELVEALHREGLVTHAPQESIPVTGVSADSRTIAAANVFFAVRGTDSDGHEFVADAVARGAAAVVAERATGAGVPEVIVADGREAARIAGQTWYRSPADELVMIGVTGTNGKTTTTTLIRHLFNAAGTAGSIGTLGPDL